jgi:hypothetical protein
MAMIVRLSERCALPGFLLHMLTTRKAATWNIHLQRTSNVIQLHSIHWIRKEHLLERLRLTSRAGVLSSTCSVLTHIHYTAMK